MASLGFTVRISGVAVNATPENLTVNPNEAIITKLTTIFARNFAGTFTVNTVTNYNWCHCSTQVQIGIIASASEG